MFSCPTFGKGSGTLQNDLENYPPGDFRTLEEAWAARTALDQRHLFGDGLPECGEAHEKATEDFGVQLCRPGYRVRAPGGRLECYFQAPGP